jgi:hypothetical protein
MANEDASEILRRIVALKSDIDELKRSIESIESLRRREAAFRTGQAGLRRRSLRPRPRSFVRNGWKADTMLFAPLTVLNKR